MHKSEEKGLVKRYIGDNLGVDMGVELADNLGTHHLEVGAQGGTPYLHVQRGAANRNVACIAGDSRSHHFSPAADQTILEQRCLDAFAPEPGVEQGMDGGGIVMFHGRVGERWSTMGENCPAWHSNSL